MRATQRGHSAHTLRASMGTLLLLTAGLGTGCFQPDTALDAFGTSGQSSVTGDDAGPPVPIDPSGRDSPQADGDDDAESADEEDSADDSVDNGPAAGGRVPDAGVKVIDAGKPRTVDASPLVSDSGTTAGSNDGGMTPVVAATLTKLSFTVTTATLRGRYSPRNIYAIWVTDGQGKFVKTLAKFAAIRARYLTGWNAASRGNVVDAVTGATVTSHGTRTTSWNFTDVSKKVVPDGDYKLVVELTDADKTGASTSIPFTKGAAGMKLTPADQANFSGMSLVLE